MRTFAVTFVATFVITIAIFIVSPAVALAQSPAPQFQLFLPVVFGPPPTPTPQPTPLPPTTPVTGTVQTLWPVKAVGVMSSAESRDEAMNGVYAGGSDGITHYRSPGEVVYSLMNRKATFFDLTLYTISRSYVEFDTTTVPADFETAQFNFTSFGAYPGPPAHHVVVHRGTWTDGGLTDADSQFLPQNWYAYEPAPLTVLPGGEPVWQPVTITLPREVINPGGITRLVFRSTAEGTVPVTQLGGAFAGLSLTVK
jgi:hypothetical protein